MMECVREEWGLQGESAGGSFFSSFFLRGLSVMRFIVLRSEQNKANVCTNSAVMEELVCLSRAVSVTTSGPPIPQSEREMVIRVGEMGSLWLPPCHQKTVVAKWLGVVGRSSWSCDASSPFCSSPFASPCSSGISIALRSCTSSAQDSCDSEKRSSSEFLNPSGASMRISRPPASSSSLQRKSKSRLMWQLSKTQSDGLVN